jgi:hypothetical protein
LIPLGRALKPDRVMLLSTAVSEGRGNAKKIFESRIDRLAGSDPRGGVVD